MWYYSLHLIWEETEAIIFRRLENMLVYSYFLKHLSLSTLISFMLIKKSLQSQLITDNFITDKFILTILHILFLFNIKYQDVLARNHIFIIYVEVIRWQRFLAHLVPLPFSHGGLLIILTGCMIFLSPFLNVTRMSMSTVSFIAQPGSGILCL